MPKLKSAKSNNPSQASIPHALYIHIPFCRHICSYCAFNVHLTDDEQQEQWVDALCQEIAYIGKQRPQLKLASVYFGGGTPSLLTEQQITHIMQTIRTHFCLNVEDTRMEIGIETNPNDISSSLAKTWHDIGLNRISLGMQSADKTMLTLFERQHDLQQVQESIAVLRSAGFTNINLDLIFGVPEQTLTMWQDTLEQALDLQPTHLSLYGLELHGGTKIAKAIDDGHIPEPDEDLAVEMYQLARKILASKGFIHYEISNWCLPNYESGHNLQYWRNLPYLGLGAGAHGYAGEQRTIVRRHPNRYIQAFQQHDQSSQLLPFPQTPATSKITRVTPQDRISETIMMGLRLTQEGIDRQRFKARFGRDIVEMKKATIQHFVERGLLEVTPNALRLTPEGYLMSNYILRDLI
jgi:oxygen-independent coproporphyrinogen-3 oxidase